jgi:hypothetical protein
MITNSGSAQFEGRAVSSMANIWDKAGMIKSFPPMHFALKARPHPHSGVPRHVRRPDL